ncbi:MAG: hypothetical protein KF859_11595 [Phycisphaeraceae bacterium]|nr:hypothetical protein [Phycisphaeraceae bacterium]
MAAHVTPIINEIPWAKGMKPWAAFAWVVCPLVVGLALGVALLMYVVLPRFGAGSTDLNRMIALGKHLDSGYQRAAVVFVGDSVTVEGIDAGVVKQHAPEGWHVENLGINGCDRAEVELILPKIVAAGPQAVVLVLRPLSIGQPPPPGIDSANAYALGGFPGAWPGGWLEEDVPWLPEAVRESLARPRWRSQVHFRVAPNYVINEGLRVRLRRGARRVQAADWNSPYNLTISISGQLLENHLRVLEQEVAEAIVDGTERHEAELEKLVALIRQGGATPVLVASPNHPRLMDAGFAPAFSATSARLLRVGPGLAEAYGGIFLDASTGVLDESGFADGQHLNEKGRLLLSEYIARRLPAPANLSRGQSPSPS